MACLRIFDNGVGPGLEGGVIAVGGACGACGAAAGEPDALVRGGAATVVDNRSPALAAGLAGTLDPETAAVS
jgi:hypothetical protein